MGNEGASAVQVIGAVAVYCDPETYPTEDDLEDTGFVKVAVGVHTKKNCGSFVSVDTTSLKIGG